MPWRAAPTEPMRCSRAEREALVSRAKRGVLSTLIGLNGPDAFGTTALAFAAAGWGVWESPSLLRNWTDFGAPWAIGCLMNLDSADVEVGRSSKASSSVPSPNARRRVGLVSVRLEAASLVKASGATSRREVGVVGRGWGLESRDIGRLLGAFSFESEEPGRWKLLEGLTLMW